MTNVRVPREYRAIGVTADEWAYEEIVEAIDDATEPFNLYTSDVVPTYFGTSIRRQVCDDLTAAGLLVAFDMQDGTYWCPAHLADRFSEPLMHVYRLYDGADRLLYIGCTSRLVRDRVASHRKKEWGSLIARVEVEDLRGWSNGWRTEAAAIIREQPIHNKLRGPRPPLSVVRDIPA